MSHSPVYDISWTTFHNVINNELRTTPTTRATLCPSNEERLWNSPVSGPDDVMRAVVAARVAFVSWSRLSQDQRAGYIKRFADALFAHAPDFIEILVKETGKQTFAATFELGLIMSIAQETVKLRLREETLMDNEDETTVIRHVPLGVGVGIMPWNFPLLMGVGKLIPALLAGNTFIWKPSPHAPYSGLKLAELGAKIFPPGVFQALSGDETLGPLLTDHINVAKVSFTGSVEAGKEVMAACARTLKRVTLELGGNDAAVICPDVDVDSVADKVAFLAFSYSGQICRNIRRVYVHERIYDRFLAVMAERARNMTSGGKLDFDAQLGPIQNPTSYERLRELYSQIAQQGWETAVGGDPGPKQGAGFFLPPTIIDNPPDDSEIVVNEQFGPILPVLRWSNERDVIRRVNASRLGLGASVWSRDIPRAERMAKEIEAGTIWVNGHFLLDGKVPLGGHKESGFGMEWAEEGLKGWCNPQVFWVNKRE
ncbi:aldehyde dehydrogenase [Xylaria palmicola]|nr:aldehyde dehydrogenase [Xylaria palmicola]